MIIVTNNTGKDVAALTFAQLKAMVPGTKEMGKLPSYKKLMEMKPEVLLAAEDGELMVTVYSNGYYTASRNGYVTVYSVDRCSSIEYRFDDGSSMTVPESEYADGSWLMPLSLVADHRLEHSADCRADYQAEFTADTIGTERRSELSVPDYATQMELQELEDLLEKIHQKRLWLLEEAMQKLTDRQSQIVELYFRQGLSQRQVAAELGVANTTVQSALEGAVKKLKKYIEKNI